MKIVDPFIGDLPLNGIHDGTVFEFVQKRLAEGISHRTINIALQRVTRVLRLAAFTERRYTRVFPTETGPLRPENRAF